MPKTHRVELTQEQRELLRKKVSRGVSPTREIARARAALGADADVAREAGTTVRAAERVRRRLASGGREAALSRRAQTPRPERRKPTDEVEARLVAAACSEAPAGRARWTRRPLADRAVELGAVEGGPSHESVRRAPEGTSRARALGDPGRGKCGARGVHGGRARAPRPVARARVSGGVPRRDAGAAPLHAREPLPMRPGSDAKEDHEHGRGGMADVFAALDLKGGRRLIEAAERRAEGDFARFVRRVVGETCAGTEGVRLVLDDLSTHPRAALDEAFAPEEALRLAQALELRFAPKHGSWLSAVEMEFSAAKAQRPARRVASLEDLRRELGAWQDERNARGQRVRWAFDVPAARAKLRRIYPTHEP